jgi:uncharacterized membrane protein YjgN (DUF898 family)
MKKLKRINNALSSKGLLLIFIMLILASGCKQNLYDPVLNQSLIQYVVKDQKVAELGSALTQVKNDHTDKNYNV